MEKHTLLDRTALTAIAAALALLSTPAMAQDAAPPQPDAVVIDPVTVPEAPPALSPVEPAAPAPVVAEPAPAVPLQTVQSVPTEPEVQPVRTEARSAAAKTPMARIAPAPDVADLARDAIPLQQKTQPDAAVAPRPADPGFAAGPVVSAANLDSTRTAQSAPASEPVAGASFWLIIGATVLAVLASLASLIFLSRRDGGTTRRAQPAERAAQSWTQPLAEAPARKVATPAASMPAAGPGALGTEAKRLDAMVKAAPSADNPFLTRRNRIRRANFILAKGHAPAVAVLAPAEPAVVEKPARREQLVSAIWSKQPAKKTQRSNRPLLPVGRQLKPATS